MRAVPGAALGILAQGQLFPLPVSRELRRLGISCKISVGFELPLFPNLALEA